LSPGIIDSVVIGRAQSIVSNLPGVDAASATTDNRPIAHVPAPRERVKAEGLAAPATG